MRKVHCEDCNMTKLQRAWKHLSPIRFFMNSRSFCQGMHPWNFYTYLPIAAIRFYRYMIPDVIGVLRRKV